MNAVLTCEEVVALLEDSNSDWALSDDESNKDAENEDRDTVPVLRDPLDFAQAQVDSSSSSVLLDDGTSSDGSSISSESENQLLEVSPPSNLSVPEQTAFDPPPFSEPVGPTTILSSTASPLDFFLLLLTRIFFNF